MARVMYSSLMGWIVSLMTTFRISAAAGSEKIPATTMLMIKRSFRQIFLVDEECIGPSLRLDDKALPCATGHPRPLPIVPPFGLAGVNFLGRRLLHHSRAVWHGSPSR